MRQGNGTDLLGNDPRSASVGIIYVSATDERKSVLAALITQEKFQRKQVAIVLPPGQNKAFQRPVDFDDLKNVRRKLQTEIVFIAPSGPGPAEFARQRRFHVYSSLESYAKALREDQSLGGNSNVEKKSGLFGLGKPKSPVPSEAVDEQHLPAQAVPIEPNVAQQRGGQQGHGVGVAMGGAVAGAAAMGAADFALHAHDNAIQDVPTAQNIQSPMNARDAQAYTNNAGAHVPTTPRPTFDMNDDPSQLPPPQVIPSPTPPQNVPSQPNGGHTGGYAGGQGSNPGPNIIELSPVNKRAKPTVKLPIAGVGQPEVPAIAPIPFNSGTNKVPSGNTSKMAAAGTGVVAGAALGATMFNRGGGAGTGTSQRASAGGAGTGTPQRANTSRPKQPNNRPRRRRSGFVLLIAALVLLALLLSCVGFAYLQPTTFASVVRSVNSVVPSLAGTTTVTIVPDNQIVAHSYVISAVTGTPDPNQRQVKAFPLSETPTAKSATVAATGRKDIAATPAKGTLSFTNGNTTAAYTFGTKTPIVSTSGITVFLDAPVTIPAADPRAGTLGRATGTATTATGGTQADIPANGINIGGTVSIFNNSAFTGGRDAAHYNFVKQSDIDTAAQPLQASLTQDAQNKLKTLPATGQALASGSQCTPKVTSDHLAGDTGVNVANVTVTVSVTCTAEAYDAAGLQALAKTLLRQQVDQDPALGKDYQLQGQVVTDTSIESIKNGTVFLSVNSKGLYAYAGLDAQKSQLANLIKGKTAAQAITLLKSQGHVKDASLPSGVTTLPTDATQIIIVIQMPQGFSGGGTTNGGNPAPTTVTGNG